MANLNLLANFTGLFYSTSIHFGYAGIHEKRQAPNAGTAGLLYEREMNAELAKLDKQFAAWRGGGLSPFGLAEKIHHFHQHPARELYVRYTYNGFEDVLVAQGIASGKLKAEEVPPEVAEALAGRVALFLNQ